MRIVESGVVTYAPMFVGKDLRSRVENNACNLDFFLYTSQVQNMVQVSTTGPK